MKKITSKVSIFAALLFAFFTNAKSNATEKSTINKRVNKIRATVRNEIKKGAFIELTGKEFADKTLENWVNWGNWGNWNNWNNWNQWNQWNQWANWINV